MLGLQPNQYSEDELKKAYRDKAKANHPDKGGDKEVFQTVQKAYETLKNPENKGCYDAFGPNFEEVEHIQLFKQALKAKDIVTKVSVSLKSIMKGTHVKLGKSQEKIFIPAGTLESDPIRLKGQGQTLPGKIPGDLLIVVKMNAVEGLKRVGNHLLC